MNTPAPRQEITYDTTEVLFVLPLDVVMNRPCKRSTRQFFSGLAVTISPGEDEEEREAAFFFFFFFFFFFLWLAHVEQGDGKSYRCHHEHDRRVEDANLCTRKMQMKRDGSEAGEGEEAEEVGS